MGAQLEELERTLAARLRTLAEVAETLDVTPGMTIRPESSLVPTMHTPHGTSIDQVDAALKEWKPPEEPLELRTTIGEGGMGLVHLGYQRSLRRPVAVKAMRPDLLSPKNVKKLLSEARVTGALEHPNVVPVHEIATRKDGAPMIVLKRIEGVHWGELLHKPDELRERHAVEDPLEWHLEVLISVANAVAFAHSRGVLHRDLKPENVMIGAFGEVYVLDWGLAVHVGDAPPPAFEDLPAANEADQMAGTPRYMAPEMLGGDPPRLSKRTDVYLLGATLYEILAGKPPHDGQRLIDVLRSVVQSEPALPDDVPEELADIVRRAMARDPDARFESVVAFRDAIGDFLRHRGSIELTKQAELREKELDALLASIDAGAAPPDEGRIASLFAEARFGFRQALASWALNPRAHEGQDRVIIRMARWALAHEDPRGAARLLSEIEAPPEDLRAEAERALDADRAGKDELRRIREQLEPRVGMRFRLVLAGLLGALWTLAPIVVQFTVPHTAITALDLATAPLVLVVVMAGLAWWKRDVVTSTAVNRRLFGAGMLVMVAEASVHLGGSLAGMTPSHTHTASLLLFGLITGALALMFARVLLLPAAGYLLAFFLSASIEGAHAFAQSGANLVFTAIALWAWSRARNPLAVVG
jgi:serine/threonine-protein kinase